MAPWCWTTENDTEFAAILLVSRIPSNATATATASNSAGDEELYKMVIINTNAGLDGGLDYHPCTVNPIDGTNMKATSIEINNIPKSKVINAAFW